MEDDQPKGKREKVKGSNGDGSRAVDMGDGEEEQLFPRQGVRTWQR